MNCAAHCILCETTYPTAEAFVAHRHPVKPTPAAAGALRGERQPGTPLAGLAQHPSVSPRYCPLVRRSL